MERIFILLILGLLVLGCVNQPNTQQPTVRPSVNTSPNTSPTQNQSISARVTVHIRNFTFEPASVNIHSGDTVVWINDDIAPHTIKGSNFESPTLNMGQSFEHTYVDVAGQYPYICGIHPAMHGSVGIE